MNRKINYDDLESNYRFQLQKPVPDYNKLKNYSFAQLSVPNFEYGIGLIPNCKCHDILIHENKLVWAVEYNVDSLGRRQTPDSINKKAEKFITFYGGSRTFGKGVSDAETLPNQFQKLVSDYTVYNYGVSGAGPNIFLKKHQDEIFKREIEQKKGLFLYLYDYGHASRALGSKESTWSYGTPYYDLGKNDELIYLDNFWSGQLLRSAFFYFGSKMAIYQNTIMKSNLFSEAELNADELKVLNKIFLKMKEEAEKNINTKFAVVFFDVFSDPTVKKIWQALQQSGVEVLVFNQHQLPPNDNDHYFIYDGHPNSRTYKIEAALLVKELLRRKLVTK